MYACPAPQCSLSSFVCRMSVPAALSLLHQRAVKGDAVYVAARHGRLDVALEALAVGLEVLGRLLVQRVRRVGLEEEELRVSVSLPNTMPYTP